MTEAWKHWEGQVVDGRFYLRQYLGGCEHSAVFLTEYGEREPQKAAIKLVASDPGDTELQLSRWELAVKLFHPHLIRLFDMGRCQLSNMGLLYVVMEYAEEELSQVLRHRPLTPLEAREMLVPTLDALAYLHGKGFVHAHLKPANIMAVNDQLKLSADGIYRADELVRPGKPGVYDPPEIAGGGISLAGDVWSLGVTLVEALTQRPPAREGTEEAEPALPQTVSPPFADIARHCLRRDPQRRWTVADISARLREISPASQGQTTAAQKPLVKRRYIVPTAALGLALAATVVVGIRLVNPRPETRRAPSIPFEQPGVKPEPERNLATPERRQSTKRTSDEKRDSSGASPVAAPRRSEAKAKTLAGSLPPGEVVHQVLPDVPAKARNTIRGTVRVRVRVHVDPSGSVVAAKFDSPGPSRYFAELALQAARRWRFRAPKVDGRDVSSEWILGFAFARTVTKVIPVRATP